MINKSIALSLLSIFVVLAVVGGLTLAFFSNQGTSSSNTFSTGTLDLKLTDTDEIDQDSVTASFGSNTLVPGTCTGNQTLTLKNTGTVAANHAEVTLANAVTDTNSDASPDMDSFLRINNLTYDGSDVSGQITDLNGNTFKDLNDWAADPNDLDSLSLTNLNTGHDLVLDVCLDSSAGNTLQGDSVVATFTATLNQDASQ
ncbi:hypothetical protein HY357_00315 [Candidatus Roizmanbacteria bacterium]|nr:hypothetical protein [Candidatus Roizmanbacteria bacterium]